MFLFSADSGARPVPLNSCSDVLLHLRKRGRHGHLELKCWINPTESFQIAQVLFCSVSFCSFRLAVLRLHGLRLCTQAVHSHLQAPRSGRGALRRGPERGLFWKIVNNFHEIQIFSANFWFVFANLIEKATHVTIFWNLARNPGKIHQIRRKKCKIRSVCDWINEYSLIQSRKSFGDFWRKNWD